MTATHTMEPQAKANCFESAHFQVLLGGTVVFLIALFWLTDVPHRNTLEAQAAAAAFCLVRGVQVLGCYLAFVSVVFGHKALRRRTSMNTVKRVLTSKLGLTCTLAIAALQPALGLADSISDQQVVRFVGLDGKPMAGVRVGTMVDWSPERALSVATRQYPKIHFRDAEHRSAKVSGLDGVVSLTSDLDFKTTGGTNETVNLYALHEPQQLVGVTELRLSQRKQQIDVQLQPACLAMVKLTCRGLETLGRPLKWTYFKLEWNDRNLGAGVCSGAKQAFEMRLPSGKYRLEAHGSQTYAATRDFEIQAGQKEVFLELDIPETRLTHLIGQPAPELRQIKGWKNGGPVTLKELKGQCILLDFWGYWCDPCVRGMPSLMKLHDSYSKYGLVIIAIHDDSVASVAKMDERLATIREKLWGGRDLPFLVALDGGGKIEVDSTSVTANGATTAAYGIHKYPTSILIGPDGKVVRLFEAGSPESIRELEKLLKIEDDVLASRADRDWRKRFDQVYRLGTDEVLKRMPPPFIPERLAYYRSEHQSQAEQIPRAPESFFFLCDKGLEQALWRFSVPSLRDIVTHVAQLRQYELDCIPEVLNKELSGDWIARKDARPEEVLKAVERIVLEELNPPVLFERRRVEREVLVAQGRFHFAPLSGSYDDEWIHIYGDALDTKGTSGGGSGDLETFLKELGETALGVLVVNHVESPPKGELIWGWHRSGIVKNLKDAGEKERKLRLLTENLTQQTGLRFKVRRQPVEIWYATTSQ